MMYEEATPVVDTPLTANEEATRAAADQYGAANIQVRYMASIKNSPWAKLTNFTTPKIRVTPMLTSPRMPPMSRPLTTA